MICYKKRVLCKTHIPCPLNCFAVCGSRCCGINNGTVKTQYSKVSNDVVIVIGPTCPTGPTRPQSERGIEGPTGPHGESGATGATGLQGPKGPTGPQGEVGATGPTGSIEPNPYNIYVSSSAAPDGDGTQAKPFQTLSQALTAVLPNGVINVLPGDYTISEQQVLSADGVTLNGDNGATIILTASVVPFLMNGQIKL